MGPITLTCDIGKFFLDWYKGEERQADDRARKLIWAVERAVFSVFILLWMERKRSYIELYQEMSIPKNLQELLLNDFKTLGISIAWGFPEARLGWGSWLIKQGVMQIGSVIMSRRKNQPTIAENFLYGLLHITFGLYWWWMYNNETVPYVNTLIPKFENRAVQVLSGITK